LAGSRQKHYQFTAIDDCTRLRVLKIYSRLNQRTAIELFGNLRPELAVVNRRLLTVSKPSVEWPSEADFGFSRQR
jgi:hypothetical protein